MIKRHPSKVDGWLVAVISGSILLAGIMVIAMGGRDIPHLWLRVCIGLFPALLTAFLVLPLHYKIGGEVLAIRCGPMKIRVPLRDILSVKPTRNSAGAPAMSLDRLDIEYQKCGKTRHVLVSPADKMTFLTDLAVAATHLRRSGEELVPR